MALFQICGYNFWLKFIYLFPANKKIVKFLYGDVLTSAELLPRHRLEETQNPKLLNLPRRLHILEQNYILAEEISTLKLFH